MIASPVLSSIRTDGIMKGSSGSVTGTGRRSGREYHKSGVTNGISA